MSDWDEQIEQKAGEVFPDPGAKPPTAEYPLAALRHSKRGAYVLGAKWQREQLRTDEAVERVADGILASFAEVIEAQDRRLPPTTDVQRRHAEKYARAAITALLGEEA